MCPREETGCLRTSHKRSPMGSTPIPGTKIKLIYWFNVRCDEFLGGFLESRPNTESLGKRARRSARNLAVFFIDLEVPQVNALDGRSRLDLWEEFFAAAARSSLVFRHFGDADVKEVILANAEKAPETEVATRPVPKWHHSTGIYKEIVEALQRRSSKCRLCEVLRLPISDTFSALYWSEVLKKEALELPVKGTEAKIVIRPDLVRRLVAFYYYLASAQGMQPSRTESDAAGLVS